MNRFEIVGSRSDGQNLLVDISHRDGPKDVKALAALLNAFTEKTGVKHSGFGSEDAQRHAFSRLLSQLLQFSDEGNFAQGLPEKDRQKKLRGLAASVNRQLDDLVEGHRHRKIMTSNWRKPEDPAALLKSLRKALADPG